MRCVLYVRECFRVCSDGKELLIRGKFVVEIYKVWCARRLHGKGMRVTTTHGDATGYTNWCTNQPPNTGNREFVFLDVQGSPPCWTASSASFTATKSYICEYNLAEEGDDEEYYDDEEYEEEE